MIDGLIVNSIFNQIYAHSFRCVLPLASQEEKWRLTELECHSSSNLQPYSVFAAAK